MVNGKTLNLKKKSEKPGVGINSPAFPYPSTYVYRSVNG